MQCRRSYASPIAFLTIVLAGPACGAEQASALADCASIAENKLRLDCYDKLAERMAQPEQGAAMPPVSTVEVEKKVPEDEPFSLAKHWELDEAHKRGTFGFRPHNPNYALLANTSRDPNSAPFQPFIALNPNKPEISHTELSFQLGFKLKLLENVIKDSDLWFGYTQRSFWQAYNNKASSPFRDTNYQPEVMLVTPVNFDVLGMHTRFLNFGLVHQSNGQTASLSRSWNRIYAQAGLEKGKFNLLARLWYRIPESADIDDNPDIIDFMGHGDLVANYRWKEHIFTAGLRRNFNTSRGAVQLSWGFPLRDKLKGYVQFFSGYGQTLIDYNSYQQSIGLGFLIDF